MSDVVSETGSELIYRAYQFWAASNDLPKAHPDRLLTQYIHHLKTSKLRHQVLAWCVLMGPEK